MVIDVSINKNSDNLVFQGDSLMGSGWSSSSQYLVYPVLVSGIIIMGLICNRSSRSSKRFIKRAYLEPDKPIQYNLKPVTGVPRLNGWKLRLYAKLCTSFFGKLGFVSYVFKKAKFDYFRKVHYVEPPSFTPNPPTFDGPAAIPDEPSYMELDSYIRSSHKKTDFDFLTVSDFYHAYRNNTTTPSDVTEWVLSKVEESKKMKPPLCAVTQSDEETARKMARESTERFAKGSPLSFLDGVPILIKEELNCAPYHTRCGTTFVGENPVIHDCTLAYKLKQAGAILIGVANMHELGMSVVGYNIHPDHGMPRNPYDPNHYTGGSSSGSAAAVAAGLVPVAIGTDGGGSVRVPATLCGVVGLKPTFGRISFGGNDVSCHSVVHAGPICSNVTDAALVYALLAGADSKDPLSLHQPQVSLADFDRSDLSNIKIGVDWQFFRDSDGEVVRVCEEAVNYLRNKTRGPEIQSVEIPELEESRIAHTMIIFTEMKENFEENYAKSSHKLNPENQAIYETVNHVTARDYITANKQRTRSIHFLQQIFNKVDILITPACAVTAPKIESGDLGSGCSDIATSLQIAKYMLIGNLTGVPGLVVPVGYDKNGLPIGLQIMGKWWQEDKILAVGKLLEGMLKKEQPKIFFKNDLLHQ